MNKLKLIETLSSGLRKQLDSNIKIQKKLSEIEKILQKHNAVLVDVLEQIKPLLKSPENPMEKHLNSNAYIYKSDPGEIE
ncbi:MAG: hypothetical protein WC959_07410 [Kiritimatiellales bacterium]